MDLNTHLAKNLNPMMLLVLIVIHLIALVLMIAGIFLWSSRGMLFAVKTPQNIVALTFDDGPHPEATLPLLDVLDKFEVKATFFVCGKHVELYPDILREIHKRGHAIGNHTWTHASLFHFSPKVPLHEMQKTSELITEYTKIPPRFFRPPRLIQGPGAKKALHSLALQSVGARVHGKDWATQDAQAITDKVLASVKPGRIIVLHDGDADAKVGEKQKPRAGTVDAAEKIIKALQEDYRFVSIEELMRGGR